MRSNLWSLLVCTLEAVIKAFANFFSFKLLTVLYVEVNVIGAKWTVACRMRIFYIFRFIIGTIAFYLYLGF